MKRIQESLGDPTQTRANYSTHFHVLQNERNQFSDFLWAKVAHWLAPGIEFHNFILSITEYKSVTYKFCLRTGEKCKLAQKLFQSNV